MSNRNSSYSSSGVGNTKQSTPLKYWFLTLNNHTEEEWNLLSSKVPHLCTSWTFQEEKGINETLHIQGTFTFKQKTRFEALKKILPRGHWEPNKCKGATKYCSKPSFEGARSSQFPEQIKIFRPEHPIFDEIEELCKQTPHPRTVHWFWEPNGGVGKSAFCKYMYVTYGAKIITTTKSADIVTAIDETDKIVIFDFPRCSNPQQFCPFSAIEQIKNGFITDAKLKKKARTVVMNSPHVIILANEPPTTHRLSLDRWNIRQIN